MDPILHHPRKICSKPPLFDGTKKHGFPMKPAFFGGADYGEDNLQLRDQQLET